MGRSAIESRIAGRPHGIRFAVAGPSDDGDLRALLRANPMGGWVQVAMEREPRYFAELVRGEEHQAIIARDHSTGESVAMCARSVRSAYVNGTPRPLGYIGELRVAPKYRHRFRIIREGFATLRAELHEPQRTPFYLTAIITDNHAARRLLESDIQGKPTYRPFAAYNTLAIRVSRRRATGDVEQAAAADIPDIAACLARNHSRYQLAPVWSEAGLRQAKGPNVQDFILRRSGARITGCLALWNQSHVRQAVVRGYHPQIARLRPLLNVLGAAGGFPHLPPAGQALRQVFLSLAAVDDDDPAALVDLVRGGLAEAQRRGFDLALIGLAETNPMLPALRQTLRAREYRSQLYLVHWEDGRRHADALDLRTPHVEACFL
jgi:hypothetical protein